MAKKTGTPNSSKPTGKAHTSKSDSRSHVTFNSFGSSGKFTGRHHTVGKGASFLGSLFAGRKK